MATDSKGALGFWALHVAGLWSIGIVQPIFEVLGNNPEFFVAHDTRGRDLIGLILGLCVVAPLGIVASVLSGDDLDSRIRTCDGDSTSDPEAQCGSRRQRDVRRGWGSRRTYGFGLFRVFARASLYEFSIVRDGCRSNRVLVSIASFNPYVNDESGSVI